MILAAVLGTSRHPKWKFRELLKENNCFSCSSYSYFPISAATSSENMRLCSHFRASCWELQDQQKSAHWCSWLLDFSMSMSFGVNSPEAYKTYQKIKLSQQGLQPENFFQRIRSFWILEAYKFCSRGCLRAAAGRWGMELRVSWWLSGAHWHLEIIFGYIQDDQYYVLAIG